MNEISVSLQKDYSYTWNTIRKLRDNGIIAKVDTRIDHGKEIDVYWLTSRGIIHALESGADPDLLLKNAEEISKKEYDYVAKKKIGEAINIKNQIEGIGFLCFASKLLGHQFISSLGHAVLEEVNKKGKVDVSSIYEIRTLPFPTVVKKGTELSELFKYLKEHQVIQGLRVSDLKQLYDSLKGFFNEGGEKQ